MFGYVVANLEKLSPDENQRYRSCYCGLCKTLGARHGTMSRITLNYDMTFLVLFLTSVYNREYTEGNERCFIHPFKTHDYWINEISDYAADMNVVLTYYKALDDWTDDRKALSFVEYKFLEKEHKRISLQYPNQCSTISSCLNDLSAIEKSGELNPDVPANCFGKLMGEIFTFREDEYAADLKAFGSALGKFIYIMDACIDLKRDIKKESYNPMIMTSSENFTTILNLLMADCIEKYRLLPVHQDKKLIDNILYSGVWTRYEADSRKTKESDKQ